MKEENKFYLGDVLTCKENVMFYVDEKYGGDKEGKFVIFLKGRNYKIIKVTDRNFYENYISITINRTEFASSKSIWNVPYIWKHFNTKLESRKLKLEILNNV